MATSTYDNLALCSVESITFIEANGNFGCLVDEISSVSMQNDQTEVDITGKNGRKIGTLKRDKATTFSGVSALLSGDMLGAQVGGDYEVNPLQRVDFREEIRLTDPTTATLKYEANSGIEGKEVDFVVKVVGAGIDKSTAIKQGAAATATTFTYDPATKTLTFAEGTFEEGDLVCVFYSRLVPATVLSNSTENFSKTGTASIDLMAQDICDNMYRVQIQIPRAQFSGTFTIDVGDQQTVHNFEISALAAKKGCGTEESLENGLLWKYIVWDKNMGEDEQEEEPVTPPTTGGDEPGTGDDPVTGGDENEDPNENNEPEEPTLPDTTVSKAMVATLTTEVKTAFEAAEVSEDGTDVAVGTKWITQEQSDTISAAIAEGERVSGTGSSATQTEKNEAWLALDGAKKVLEAAPEGTKAD